jgi:hypothetical protein
MKKRKFKAFNSSEKKKSLENYQIERLNKSTGCPSPRKLILAARIKLSLEERMDVLDHIDKCKLCYSEFQFIINTFRMEKDLIQRLKK